MVLVGGVRTARPRARPWVLLGHPGTQYSHQLARLGIPESVLDRFRALRGWIACLVANAEIMREVRQQFPTWNQAIEPRWPEVLACEEREFELATRMGALLTTIFPAGSVIAGALALALRTVGGTGGDS
jgi:hypothetical protein